MSSIDALAGFCGFPVETVFVESTSTDSSLEIAKTRFDRVIALVQSDGLYASGGRYVGTMAARFPWVLYLDGDMEVCPQFFPIVANIPNVEDECVGYGGLYEDHFNSGSKAIHVFFGDVLKSQWATGFGGAVLLRRNEVLRLGNWDPSIYSKEEMELYARLSNGKRVVKYVGVQMVNHYSEYFTRFELLTRLLYPGAGQGKVFYGFGQSIRSLFIKGKLGALMRLDFEPYIFFGALIIAFIGAFLLPIEWGLLWVASLVLCLSVLMRPGPVVRYLTLPIPLALGLTKYIPYFRPEIKNWSWNWKSTV